MRTLTLLILAFGLSTAVAAQDKTAVAVFLGGSIVDDATTWHNMRGGFEESNPLYAGVKNQPKSVLISLIATDVLTLWVAHHYTPTHPKIVKVMLFAFGGVHLAQGVRNANAWNAYANRPIFTPNPH